MITDERLKAIIESTPEYETYLLDALNELVSLRSQVKALREDGERLAKMVEQFCHEAGHRDISDDTGNGGILAKHTALLKDLDK